MFLTNLRVVQRILPRHLEAVVDEVEHQVVMKGWFLDDALPIGGELGSPAQRFFRSSANRLWLDAATGDLLTIFLLDTNVAEISTDTTSLHDSPQNVAIDILVEKGTGAFVQATHQIASIFEVRLDALPALILYTSRISGSYVTVSFHGLKTDAEVKERCAMVLQEIRDAAIDVFGRARTDALAMRSPVAPITEEEALQILRRVERSVNGNSQLAGWLTVVTGANAVYTLLEHVGKLLKHLL